MTAVVVLGAGDLGGAVAQAVASSGAAGRVTIVDEAAEVARGKALDIRQAGAVEPYDVDLRGTADLAAVVGATAIVLADRHGPAGEWRGDDALGQLARVRALNPGALVLCAGAGQLDVVECAVLEQDADRSRLFATAPDAQRAAVTALACLEAGCAPGDVSLAVLGRPPAAMFVPWTDAAIGGLAATTVLDAPALARLDARLPRLWPPGPTALGVAAARVVRLAVNGGPGSACLFAVPARSGDAVLRGAVLPAAFTPAGVRVTVPRLASRDRVRLDGALGR